MPEEIYDIRCKTPYGSKRPRGVPARRERPENLTVEEQSATTWRSRSGLQC